MSNLERGLVAIGQIILGILDDRSVYEKAWDGDITWRKALEKDKRERMYMSEVNGNPVVSNSKPKSRPSVRIDHR